MIFSAAMGNRSKQRRAKQPKGKEVVVRGNDSRRQEDFNGRIKDEGREAMEEVYEW